MSEWPLEFQSLNSNFNDFFQIYDDLVQTLEICGQMWVKELFTSLIIISEAR